MGVATKPRAAIVFLMILAVFLSLGLPAEDVPETAYDESEAPPYEGTSPFSIVAPPVRTRTDRDLLSCLHLELCDHSRFTPPRVHDTDANRSTDARVSLALLCTLLC